MNVRQQAPRAAATTTDQKPEALKKGELCRHKILEAARQLFYRKGFFATSINDVAEAAGVHKGNLSYYFPSKSELLESTTAARLAEIRAEMAEWDAMGGTLYQVLDAVVRSIENHAEDIAAYGCEIGTLANELGKGDGELQDPARQLLELLQSWLTDRFAQQFPKAQARDHAEHFLIMTQGAAVMAHAHRDAKIVVRQCKRIRQWLLEICPD